MPFQVWNLIPFWKHKSSKTVCQMFRAVGKHFVHRSHQRVTSTVSCTSVKAQSTRTSSTGPSIASSSSTSSDMSTSAQPLYASQRSTQVGGYAEMMDEENMAWGPPKRRRR
ncbi:hypothetical protein BC827DRAFT_1192795 [Russula dissimulans]|nr:hypothetical protein BC827DRAFT_1192795 [Russula dissimulans]